MKSLEQLMRKCQQWLLAVDLQLVCMTSSLARVLAELGIGCKPLHEGQDVQRMHWHLSRQLSVAVDAEVGRAISVRGCTMPCSIQWKATSCMSMIAARELTRRMKLKECTPLASMRSPPLNRTGSVLSLRSRSW